MAVQFFVSALIVQIVRSTRRTDKRLLLHYLDGLPDLNKLRAFVARGGQSVTYGAAVWHGSTCSVRGQLDMTMFMYTNGVAADITELVQIEGGLSIEY